MTSAVVGGSFICDGPGAQRLWRVLERGLRTAKAVDGGIDLSTVEEIRDLRRAAGRHQTRMSGVRHDQAKPPPPEAQFPQSIDDPHEITVLQAAPIIGVCDRQVYRLLRDDLDLAVAIVRTKPIRLDHRLVQAYALRRQNDRSAA